MLKAYFTALVYYKIKLASKPFNGAFELPEGFF
jgi:hypothetical protein